MKYLLVILVVAIVLWLMFGRGRGVGKSGAARNEPGAPAAMLACSHCGVHLPSSEAVADAAGRSFCSEAHRLAGPL